MRSSPRHRLLSAALAAAFGATLVSWSSLALAQSPTQAVATTFDITVPAQPLAAALNELSRQTGIQVLASGDLVSRLNAPAVSGRLTLQQALDRLLAGSGLSGTREGNAVVIRAAAAVKTLPAVIVTGSYDPDSSTVLQRDGTAANGYRAKTISSVGALGSMSLQDTPFAVSVVPRELMDNIQAQSPDDAYKLNPSTLSHVPQASTYAPMVKIRGFNTYDRAEDGLRRPYSMAVSMEDKERVEVLNGPSGFLFGAASPGGMVNYVSKRPTLERFNSITVGNYGGSQAFVHGDFGGQFDADGTVGYRVNLVRQDGKTSVDDQKINRTLASVALDVKPSDQLKLELDASYSDYATTAPTEYWLFREGVPRVTPDSSKNWGQPWTEDQIISKKWMAKAIYQASDALTLRLAYLRDDQDRPKQDHTLNSVRPGLEYYQLRQKVGPQRTESEAWQALADVSFDTGSINHKLTLGYFGFAEKSWQSSYAPNTGYIGPYGLNSPTHVAQPNWAVMPANSMYYGGSGSNDNLMIGDALQFNERWSALVGINRSTIKNTALNASGARTQQDYDQSLNSPNLSLVFKPVPWVTTYATYIEGLEMGGIAPATAANPLAIMSPMQTRQKELGLKLDLGGVLVSTALFDIEKAYEYTDANNVYGQDGKQRHRGAEVSAVGKLSSAWTVMGGVTLLSPTLEGGANDGKEPFNVPKVVAKLYSEYALSSVPGLSLTGGIYHVGQRWATATNTSELPTYETVDLGLRYATKMSGKPVTMRMTISNVEDRDYWLSSYYLGAPRSIAFSAQMQF